MKIVKYEDINVLELDVIKEIGSIGIGNAATALSGLLNKPTKMTLPEVSLLGFDEAIKIIGDPEEIVAAILVEMSGEIKGIMLFILKLDFINEVLSSLMQQEIGDFTQITQMEESALEEVGNIIISSYISALSSLSDVTIHLSIPSTAVNMLGGILSVPMAEFGYETDKLMIIRGKFIVEGKKLDSNILMLPDVSSLDFLMRKLGVRND